MHKIFRMTAIGAALFLYGIPWVEAAPVETEESVRQLASEPDERSAQIEQQAQTTVTAPAFAVSETGEVSVEAPEQPAVEPAENPVAVIGVEEQATVTEELVDVSVPASITEPPARTFAKPTLIGPDGEMTATQPLARPERPSFKEIFGYERPAPPKMPFRYEVPQRPIGPPGVKEAYDFPRRMMRRPFTGSREAWGYPGRYTRDYYRDYAPNYYRGYPGEGSYGYGTGYSQGYAPPGYSQDYAPGYPRGYISPGYFRENVPGYSQGYRQMHRQPQNPVYRGYCGY